MGGVHRLPDSVVLSENTRCNGNVTDERVFPVYALPCSPIVLDEHHLNVLLFTVSIYERLNELNGYTAYIRLQSWRK